MRGSNHENLHPRLFGFAIRSQVSFGFGGVYFSPTATFGGRGPFGPLPSRSFLSRSASREASTITW